MCLLLLLVGRVYFILEEVLSLEKPIEPNPVVQDRMLYISLLGRVTTQFPITVHIHRNTHKYTLHKGIPHKVMLHNMHSSKLKGKTQDY